MEDLKRLVCTGTTQDTPIQDVNFQKYEVIVWIIILALGIFNCLPLFRDKMQSAETGTRNLKSSFNISVTDD